MAVSDQVKTMADKLNEIMKKQTDKANAQAAAAVKPSAPSPR